MNKSINLEELITRLDKKIDAISLDLEQQWQSRMDKISERFATLAVVGSCVLLFYHHTVVPMMKTTVVNPGTKTFAAIALDLEKPVRGGDKVGQFTVSLRDFGYHIHPVTGQKRFHNGVDINAAGGLFENSQLYVVGTGKKTKVTCLLQPQGAGLYAVLEPDNLPQRTFIAMHLNKCIFPPGESGEMTPNTVFGLVGGNPNKGVIAGTSTGPHLHWTEKEHNEPVVPKYWPLYQVMHGQLPKPNLSKRNAEEK